MTEPAARQSSLTMQSMLFAGRLFTHWCRHPTVPVQALLLPTVLLIAYQVLAGESALRITGSHSVYGLVPVCAVAGAVFGALGACLAVPRERDTGLLTRFWTLPVHRASALAGRLLAEAARTFLGTVLITLVGVALGLRFEGGWLSVLPFLALPVLMVVVFTTIVITVALRFERGSGAVFAWLGTVSVGMIFCSGGIARLETFPPWLRPIIEIQPMSPIIEAMRALAEGRPALGPLLLTSVWLLGLAAVFVPLALNGYRIAAESGA